MVSKVPDHDLGQACIDFLRGYGLNTDYFLRGGDQLGLFYLETGASQRPSKVIYDRANSAITTLKKGGIDWKAIFQDKDWFHFSGTAPALSDQMPGVVEEACRAARQMGVTVSCDLNVVLSYQGYSLCCAGDAYIRLFGFEDLILDEPPGSIESFPLKAMDKV